MPDCQEPDLYSYSYDKRDVFSTLVRRLHVVQLVHVVHRVQTTVLQKIKEKAETMAALVQTMQSYPIHFWSLKPLKT